MLKYVKHLILFAYVVFLSFLCIIKLRKTNNLKYKKLNDNV